MRKFRLIWGACGTAAAGIALLAGCTTAVAPSIAQYGVVTGKGLISNQEVKQVVNPGQNVSVAGGDTVWYLPADVRNYVTAPTNGDRNNPSAELTGNGPGNSPGMQDYTWSYLAFEVNPAIAASNHKMVNSFMPFCLKYGCASLTAQVNNQIQNSARSSTPGWEAMLNEIMPRAIDNATRLAISSYGPSLWNDQGEWTAFGNKIASYLPAQIAELDGSGSIPYFCGPGSTETDCKPFIFVVNNVRPVDQQIVNAYNQQVTAQYQQQAAAARLAAAKGVYGPDANWFLGMEDLVNTCQNDKTPCTFYVGEPPVHP